MISIWLISFYVLHVDKSDAESSEATTDGGGGVEMTEQKIRVPRGWPAEVDCRHLVDVTAAWGLNISCTVRSYPVNFIVHTYTDKTHHPYRIAEVSQVLRFIVFLKIDFAYDYDDGYDVDDTYFANVTVVPVDDRSDVDEVANDDSKFDSSPVVKLCTDSTLKLYCEVPSRPNSVQLFVRSGEYNVTWYRNGSPLDCRLHKDGVVGRSHFSILTQSNQSLFPGKYSCAITYNDRTQFVYFTTVCITGPDFSTKPQLAASKHVVMAQRGENVELTCTGLTGRTYKWSRLGLEWKRLQDKPRNVVRMCSMRQKIGESVERSSSYSCYANSSARTATHMCSTSLGCHGFDNSPDEFRFSLRLSNVQEEGRYQCSVFNTHGEATQTIELRLYVPLLPVIVGLIAAAGVLSGMLLALLYFKPDLQILCKKYRRSYDSDDRLYAAYFSYFFDRELTSESNRRLICDIVTWSETHNYALYDPHRCACAGAWKYESQKAKLSKCHRMLVYLTSHHLRNENSLFELQMGIYSCIHEGMMLIFVVTREVLHEVEAAARMQDLTCRCLLRMMRLKGNTTIISGSSRKKLYKSLEIAMPKLRSSPGVKQYDENISLDYDHETHENYVIAGNLADGHHKSSKISLDIFV